MIFMRPYSQRVKEQNHLFKYLLFLTFFFILLEISYFIQRSEIYLGDFSYIADRIQFPLKIIPSLLYFLSVQLFFHVLFTVFIWGIALTILVAHPRLSVHAFKIAVSLWIFGLLTMLFLNSFYYPNSKFSGFILVFLTKETVGYCLIALFIAWIFIASVFLKSLFFIFSLRTFVIAILIFSAAFLFYHHQKTQKKMVLDAASTRKPNIILIGIDSLRPDFLGYFGYEKQSPAFDHFLNEAVVFSSAITPLARTFPAWMSILTGVHPKTSGIRFNLPGGIQDFSELNTLPKTLKQNGYETIFATDEVRFSNIDERFGFDKIITPPIGVADFLLGDLNDFPLTNWLVNTRLGMTLFPFSYANRPVFATYNPDSFLRLLQKELQQNRKNPLFFAVHFCLPHYPYFWGQERADDESIHNYRASVRRVDQQFGEFMRLLQENNLLEHAIVVLLSDHGEAIELPGDRATEADLFIPSKDNPKKIIPRFYPPSFDFETVNQSAGHGTDVMSLTQYHIVLGVKLFGLGQFETGPRDSWVSLLDIKPTVLDFLKYPYEGTSLMNSIRTKEAEITPNRHLFIESDFSPQAIRSVHPETHELLFQGLDYYQIDTKTMRVSVRKNMVDLIISSKQYADIFNEWILALYPQTKTTMTPILLNMKTGFWTNDLQTEFAKASPAALMLANLKQFYGSEITSVDSINSIQKSI